MELLNISSGRVDSILSMPPHLSAAKSTVKYWDKMYKIHFISHNDSKVYRKIE